MLFIKWPIAKGYAVFSPEYKISSGSYDEPPEYGCDYLEVIANTKKEAIAKAVCLILKTQTRSYAEDNRSDNMPPFKGYKADRIWLWRRRRVW